MTVETAIAILEDGFFLPPGALREEHACAEGFQFIGVAGLAASLQFVRTRVRTAPSTAVNEHIVVAAHYPALGEEAVAAAASALEAAYPQAIVSFMLGLAIDESYVVRAKVSCREEVAKDPVVAAVAAAACFGILAEVSLVLVEVRGVAFAATMRLDAEAGEWRATVRAAEG